MRRAGEAVGRTGLGVQLPGLGAARARTGVVVAFTAVLTAACAGGPAPRGAGAAVEAAPGARAPAEAASGPAAPAGSPPVGRPAVERAVFPPLRFHPPEAERLTLSNGVPVFYLEDRTLPLVTLFADFRGGFPHFGREDFGAATAVAPLLLSGGTTTLPPDSVDELVEFYALGPSVGTAGERNFSAIGTLSRHLDVALSLWADMLRNPRFDPERVEAWRLRELDAVRRMRDQPASVAIAEFNHVMYGDHYVGWIMDEADLAPERLSAERLRRVHREIYCAGNLVLGVTGDLGREEALRKLEATFGEWPACPRKLERPAPPRLRSEGGVVLVHREINQSTIVMGQPGGVVQRDTAEYFAAQIANWILGGSGLSSRILSRVRTEAGLSYDAWSVWTSGSRGQGVFGAFAQTKGETTMAAAGLVREIIEEMRRGPPSGDEVSLAVDNILNGFVFAFEDPASVVSRQMSYLAAGLPPDWLERYLEGIQGVTPAAVHEVVGQHLRPGGMTVVIVGDTTRFEAPASTLGPVIRR